MRVSPVSNYRKNNVAFGKFADENARTTVKKALTTNDRVMKPTYDSWFGIIEKCDFFEAYTDKKDGIVKGRFTDEFIKNNGDDRNIRRDIESLKRNHILDDLSNFDNADVIANSIPDFENMVKGIDLSKKWRSKNPYEDARAEEQRKQEMLDNLAK